MARWLGGVKRDSSSVLVRGIVWQSHRRRDRLRGEGLFRGGANVENRPSSRKARYCVFNIN
jgi:hypothetical protein